MKPSRNDQFFDDVVWVSKGKHHRAKLFTPFGFVIGLGALAAIFVVAFIASDIAGSM
jgi:hypothetical protein